MGSVQKRANRILEAGANARLQARLRAGAPLIATLAVSAVLAACVTPQERAIRNQAEVEQMMVLYGPACERLGYAPNTDAWRSCVLQLNARDDLQRYQTSPGYYGGGAGYWRGGWWRPIW